MAYERGVEPRGHGAGLRGLLQPGEADRFIAERRQDFLVPQQAPAVHLKHQHGLTDPAANRADACGMSIGWWDGAAAGSQTSKRVPLPGVLRTSMAPLCSLTMSRAVASPRPLPSGRVVKEDRKPVYGCFVHAAPGIGDGDDHEPARSGATPSAPPMAVSAGRLMSIPNDGNATTKPSSRVNAMEAGGKRTGSMSCD